MKLGLSMYSYNGAVAKGLMDIPGFIRECKRLDVQGVELLDFYWKDKDAEMPGVETALRETNLPVGVYSVGNNFVQPDAGARDAQVKIITDGVDMARRFGAQVVRVFAGDIKPGITFEQALGWIVEGLTEAAEYAYDNGITLALENHGQMAGRSEQVETILNAVASPALKANPDMGNFILVHQAPHDAVAALATRAAMAHFKDFALVPDDYDGLAFIATDGLKYRGTAIGEGDVDLPDCITSLRRAGFDGWINIEFEASEDPLVGVPRSVANAKRLLG